MKTIYRATALLALSGATLAANADIAFSNLSQTGPAYDKDEGFGVPYSGLAFEFTSESAGVVDGIEMGITDTGSPISITARIYSAPDSSHFGALLGTYSGQTDGVAFGDGTPIESISMGSAKADLSAGEDYWLYVLTPQAGIWNCSNNSSYVNYLTGGGSHGDFIAGAFQVDTRAVATPGPSTGLTFGASGVAAWLRRRKK